MLASRDRDHHYSCFWLAMLIYMWEYVDGKEILREELLRPSCMNVYRALRSEGGDLQGELENFKEE